MTADTSMTAIVHRVLCRDLTRTRTALTQWPYPDPSQRTAIAEHLVWMNSVVRLPVPAQRLNAAANRYAGDPHARADVLAALAEVEAAIEGAELGQGHDCLTRSERALVKSWLMDGAADRAYRCWYLPQHSRLRRQLSGRVSVDVAAPVDAVWKVVADPTRTPQWSHECQHVEYLDGATAAGRDRRFRGTSRSGRITWSRICTVFTFEENREFGYLTSGGPGDSTAWHFLLESIPSGTRLTQVFQIVTMPQWASRAVAVLVPSHTDRTDALRADLQRLGALAERNHNPALLAG